MNKHFYRIIFNKARGIMMVVAEIVKRHQGEGRSSQKASSTTSRGKVTAALKPLSFLTFVALGMVSVVTQSQASTIIADNSAAQSQRPNIVERPNGPTVVNIQEANGAGVSHNKYNQFDVSREGVILNNSAQSSNTQLGGNIAGNSNLAHSGGAKVILNEINSANASQLSGKIEVAGQKAQVVIANAAGITCNGCGFINADRATLTTGKAIIGADGTLQGYQVEQGNITLNRIDNSFYRNVTLNSDEQDYTDLIARTVNINGIIHANNLTIIAGKNKVSHDLQTIETLESNDIKPEFSIDSSALGGMSSDKITLISTEGGVGVHYAGGNGEFNITAEGKIVVGGSINPYGGSSFDNVNFYSKDDIEMGGFFVNKNMSFISDKSIKFTRYIEEIRGEPSDGLNELSAWRGALIIQAGGDFYNEASRIDGDEISIIAGGKIVNTRELMSSDLTLNAKQGIYNKDTIDSPNLKLTTEQAINNDGRLDVHDLTLTAAEVTNSGVIYRTGYNGVGDLNITVNGKFTNTGIINVSRIWGPQQINLTVNGQFDNMGNIFATSGINLMVDGLFTNTGDIDSQGGVNINANKEINNSGSIYGSSLSLTSQRDINNSGTIHAPITSLTSQRDINNSGTIHASITSLTSQKDINNSGTLSAYYGLVVKGANVNNSGMIQNLYNDSMTVAATGTLTNSGKIKSAKNMNLAVNTLNNNVNGEISSGGALNIGKTINSQGKVTGKAQSVNNHSATIESKGNLTINAEQINNINDTFSAEEKVSEKHVNGYTAYDERSGTYYEYSPEQAYEFYWGPMKANMLKASDDRKFLTYKYYDYIEKTYQTVVNNEGIAAKISSGGNLTLSANKVINDNSVIKSDGNRTITGKLEENIMKSGTSVVKEGTGYNQYRYTWAFNNSIHREQCDYGSSAGASPECNSPIIDEQKWF
ncbi:filamentous hemagglutinin N-terminal domain-containing protein [Orbus sturtevantii]|uniref:two-partner secretion domain-containing protein n=1 Tax=Orbus sturtevantii TaxID=3074109 RepID=UPI00370D8512